MEPITSPNTYEEPPNKLDKLQTEFVSVVSHELRTPVSAIQGYADLLLEGAYGDMPSEQRDIVDYIKQSAGGLMGMIDNLLSLSLLNRGQTDLVLKTFAVEEVIKGVLMTCRADYEHKKLSVSYRIEPNDLRIRSDRTKLLQILTNLVANAIRYTKEGWIKIDARQAPAGDPHNAILEISVSDSGAGISQEDQKQIFERFFRGEMSSRVEREGMGLGLYIVHSLARMVGGEIGVESELQKGSTFTVRMPVAFDETKALQNLVQLNQAARGQGSGAPSANSPLERIVLFLGDDPQKSHLLGDTLRHEGIQVVTASDMQQVVEKVALLRPLAIIFDPNSSHGNNGKVFQDLKLHPATKSIPVLFFMDSKAGAGVNRLAGLASPNCDGGAAGNQPASPAKGTRTARTYRVLITDDDPCMREALQLTLESEGYQVLLAGDGHEALRQLTEQRPDVMLLDLMMPGLNGWELMDILAQKPELSGTKVLMLTGASLSAEEAQKLTACTRGLLRKDELKLNSIVAGVAQAIEQG